VRLIRLAISNVRRIAEARIDTDAQLNLICGPNGSGKTSLLESIHYLSTARSFRTIRASDVITDGAEALLVSGEFNDSAGRTYRVGVEKTRSSTRLRLNGEPLNIASKIARLIPVLTFNSESFALLDGGPANRRALLDRLLFHVEQDYLAELKNYYRALKHRNALLRSRAARSQFGIWDEQLHIAARKIDDWRTGCVHTINGYLSESRLCEVLGPLELEYRRGWLGTSEFVTLLEKNYGKDRESGNTSIGPHRAELRFKISAKTAKSIVSRGQGKLIIGAIVCAQARYLGELSTERPIILVDDLASELDRRARQEAFASLEGTGAQLFFTAIESTDLPLELSERARLFHVEQGAVRMN